jgi:hypothetical protein
MPGRAAKKEPRANVRLTTGAAVLISSAAGAWFVAVGAIGAKTLQYVMFRMIVRRRIVQFRWITLADHQNDHQIDERHEARQPQTF